VDRTEEDERLGRELGGIDGGRAERTVEVYERLDGILGEYRDDATGHGDFESYVELRTILAEMEEEVDEVYHGDRLEDALDRFDSRTLTDTDFERAREDLEDMKGFVGSYERYRELGEELRDELGRLRSRRRELEARADGLRESLERAREAEEVDAAPLREAVEGYNRRVEDGFEGFMSRAPAVEVVRVGERIRDSPLLPDPPVEEGDADRLDAFVDDETTDRVLELAGQSDAKLSHTFDDPEGFREAVPEGWLRTADAEPLRLSYADEGVVERRTAELVSVVSGFATEETVAALRRVRDLAVRGDYARMRRAVVAEEEAGDDADALEEELDEVEDEIDEVDGRIEMIRETLSGNELEA